MSGHPWWCETLLCTILEQYGAHRGLVGRVVEPEVLVEVWVEQRAGCAAFVAWRTVGPDGAQLTPEGAVVLGELNGQRELVVSEWNRARGQW